MTNYFLHKSIYFLLLLVISFSSCDGQDKTQLQNVVGLKTNSIGTKKLVKTQGTGPYDNVHCGLQDKSGNLWFGTTGEGVYCYGTSQNNKEKLFTNFTVKDGLSSNTIYCMLEDKNGNIWLGTKAGLSLYSPSSTNTSGKIFTNVSISVSDSNAPFTEKTSVNPMIQVWSMLQDKSGRIWFATYNDGIYCYDARPNDKVEEGITVTHFLHHDSVINKYDLVLNAVNSMIEDRQGNIWFASWFEGVCRYDGKSVTSFKPNGEVWFKGLLEDRAGNIWVGRRTSGVCRYEATGKSKNTFVNVLQKGIFDSCCIGPMAEDKLGNIWFCSEVDDMTQREIKGGVWRYDPSVSPESKAFTNFTTKDGLSHYAVSSVTLDQSGKLWFGTVGMGLCRYDPSDTLNAGGKVLPRFINFSE